MKPVNKDAENNFGATKLRTMRITPAIATNAAITKLSLYSHFIKTPI